MKVCDDHPEKTRQILELAKTCLKVGCLFFCQQCAWSE